MNNLPSYSDECYNIGDTSITFPQMLNIIDDKCSIPNQDFQFSIEDKQKELSIIARKTQRQISFCLLGELYTINIPQKIISFIGPHPKNRILYHYSQLLKELEGEYQDAYYYDKEEKAYYKVRNRIAQFISSSATKIFNLFDSDQSFKAIFNSIQQQKLSCSLIPNSKAELSNVLDLYHNIHIKTEQFTYFESEQRNKLIEVMLSLYFNNSDNIRLLTGISGIGKSMTLLSFWKCYHIPMMYINCKTLRNTIEPPSIYRQLAIESIKLFDKYEEYICVLNEIRKTEFYQGYWSGIKKIIQYLLSMKEKRNYLLLIDQFKDSCDNQYLKELITMVQGSNVKVLLCSSINENEIRNNLINQWKGIQNESTHKITNFNVNYMYLTELTTVTLTKEESNNSSFVKALTKFGMNLKYYSLFKERLKTETSIKIIMNEEKERIYKKISSFLNNNEENIIRLFLYVLSYFKSPIDLKTFEAVVPFVPLKYFTVSKEDNMFRITPIFPTIYSIIQEKLPKLVSTHSQQFFKFNSLIKNNSFLGIFFEYIIHTKFFERTLPFSNVYISEVIKVKDILTLHKQKQCFIPCGASVYVIPKNQNAALYDSCIIKHSEKDNYQMFLLQMTINKKSKKLLTRNKIVESYNIIIDSFKNIFGGELKRENISFYYIFLRNQHLNELETYCINNKLPYMSYSIEKNKFYNSDDEEAKDIEFITLSKEKEPNVVHFLHRKRLSIDIRTKHKLFTKKQEETILNLFKIKEKKIKQQLTVYSIEQVNWDHLIVFICKEYYLLIIKNSCNKRMSKYYVKTKKFILISKKNYFTVFSDMVMKHEYNKIIHFSYE